MDLSKILYNFSPRDYDKVLQDILHQSLVIIFDHSDKLNPKLFKEIDEHNDWVPFIVFDTSCNKYFLCSKYNRDGDSYRSPWSGNYIDEKENLYKPDLEIELNEKYNKYRKLTYRSGISSVYVWNRDSGVDGFCAVFLLSKDCEVNGVQSRWAVIHNVTVTIHGSSMEYVILSTLYLLINNDEITNDIGISLEKKTNIQKLSSRVLLDDIQFHINVITGAIEDIEKDLYNQVEMLYCARLLDIQFTLRTPVNNYLASQNLI